MKQQDVTYKTEVTTTVIQEPSVVVSQYELEQRKVTTPVSYVTEKVCSLKSAFIHEIIWILFLLYP